MAELFRFAVIRPLRSSVPADPAPQGDGGQDLGGDSPPMSFEVPSGLVDSLREQWQIAPEQARSTARNLLAELNRPAPSARTLARVTRLVSREGGLGDRARDRILHSNIAATAIDFARGTAADMLALARVAGEPRPERFALAVIRGAQIFTAVGAGGGEDAVLVQMARAPVRVVSPQGKAGAAPTPEPAGTAGNVNQLPERQDALAWLSRPRSAAAGEVPMRRSMPAFPLDLQTDFMTPDLSTEVDRPAQPALPSSAPAVSAATFVPYAGGHLRPPSAPVGPTAPSVPETVGEARVLGVADLQLIQERFDRYEFGEISHVENVLATESRNRTHELETTTLDETETTTLESETLSTELSTAERFELQRAIETVQTQDQAMNFGVSASYGFGPVMVGADFSMGSSSSEQTATSLSESYARDLTERALSEVVRSVDERRLVSTQVVTKETNYHGFENDTGAHVVGIYRYLDKIVACELQNYGARLMLEFVVPEPAALLVHALTASPPPGVAVVKPADLSEQPGDIDESNYQGIAARYGVRDVTPPPPLYECVAHTITVPAADRSDYPAPEEDAHDPDLDQPYVNYDNGDATLTVPEGYFGDYVLVRGAFPQLYDSSNISAPDDLISICVGYEEMTVRNHVGSTHNMAGLDDKPVGSVPVAWAAKQKRGLAATVSLFCKRLDATFEDWRMQTWASIEAGYKTQLESYNSQVSFAGSYAGGAESSSDANRAVERRELKRGVISLLTDQNFELFGALSFDSEGFPTMIQDEARAEGDYAQFFELGFEWDLMAYEFFAYVWAGPERWLDLMTRTSSDPTHQEFLRAGSARVTVPVRPGYEKAVLDFLDTGAVAADPTVVELPAGHIWEEALQTLDEAPSLDAPITVGEPWELVVPTSLIILQTGPDPNDPTPVTA